jgi:hypothetical protein
LVTYEITRVRGLGIFLSGYRVPHLTRFSDGPLSDEFPTPRLFFMAALIVFSATNLLCVCVYVCCTLSNKSNNCTVLSYAAVSKHQTACFKHSPSTKRSLGRRLLTLDLIEKKIPSASVIAMLPGPYLFDF